MGDSAYPMVADQTHEISRIDGVLREGKGIAIRRLFLIDREGNARHMLVNDLPLGRSVNQAIRMVDALRFFEQNGEVCPANWKPGEKSMKPGREGLKLFFKDWANR